MRCRTSSLQRPITRRCGRACTWSPTSVPDRLNRYLASAGVGSRRAVDELIRDARVTVNGAVAELGTSVGEDDEVCVDGRPVRAERQARVMVHTPAGVGTTANDSQGRPTVLDL